MEPPEMLSQAAAERANQPAHHMTEANTGEDQAVHAKAQHLWSTLGSAIHLSIDKIRRTDWKPLELEHGLQLVQRVRFKRDIQHIMFNVVSKEFVCMVSKTKVHIYQSDGRKTLELSLREPLEGLVYAKHIDRYVGWNRCPQLKVLSSDFQTLSVNQAGHSVTCCCYNQDLNQIVTAGAGNVCCWHFFFGCRDLLCGTVVTDGLTQEDVFTHLVLERCPASMPAATIDQRCYAVCRTGVAAFNLTKGTLLSYEKHLHGRKITGIVIVATLRCVATSSRDGNIKVWDQNWNLQMMFVGHLGPVTALAAYPDGPCLLSASKDGSLRLWSLEMVDQVGEIQVGATITCLGTVPGEDNVFTYAKQQLDLWSIERLYRRHMSIGHAVRSINVDHISLASLFPLRAACSCDDGTARLISPETGDVHSTLLLEQGQLVVGLDYCLPREALLVLTDQGDLLKANSLTNPMEVLMKVPHSNQVTPICCFCIYAQMAKVSIAHSRWLQVVAGGSEEKIKHFGMKDRDWYLIVAGHASGLLSVLDWRSGNTQYKVQAHESGKVLTLVPDPENQRLFSSGMDNAVKLWRVFPYAQDSLALLMSFFGAHPPTHLCLLKGAFIAALQSAASAVHSIVLYDLKKKIRKDHHPDHDHHDEITDLCSLPELKIFASTSRRGTLKIWDHKNQLLRIVHLMAFADSISFCNNKGDMLLGIEKNLHYMSSDEFLIQSYRLRVACRDHSDPVSDNPVPLSKSAVNSLSPSDRWRLTQVRSFKHSGEHPQIIPEKPDEEIMKKQEHLKEAYAVLAAREAEILLIQRGELKSKKKRQHTKEVLQEGFRGYMRLLYGDGPHIKIRDQEADGFADVLMKPPARSEPPHVCTNIRKGFFPHLTIPHPWSEVTESEREARGLPYWSDMPEVPIALDGFIPNSVFLRLLWPMEPWHSLDDLDSEEQLAAQEEPKAEVKLPAKIHIPKELQLSDTEHTNSFLDRLEALDNESLDKMEIKSESDLLSVRKMSKTISRPSIASRRSLMSRDSLVSRTTTDSIGSPQPQTPPVQQMPELPPASTLPAVVEQYKDEDWFKKIFPDFPDNNVFPLDMTEEEFIEMLLEMLKTADFDLKQEIMKALSVLLPNKPSHITESAEEIIITILRRVRDRRKTADYEEFIRAALFVMNETNPHSMELMVELMVTYFQGDIDLRNTVKGVLDGLGLHDPHDLFEEELNNWGSKDGGKTMTQQRFRIMSRAWLREWMHKFKDHVHGARKSLREGGILRATAPHTDSSVHEDHHRDSTFSRMSSSISLAQRRWGSAMSLVERSRSSGISLAERSRSSGISLAEQRQSSHEIVRPIEAVNYFCEVRLAQKLQALRAQAEPEDTRSVRNTVLLPPKVAREQAILRLGETRSYMKKERSRLPPLSFNMGRVIRLPVSKVALNPFPSLLDRFPVETVLLTLRQSVQRYFILERSVVANYS
ncbi:WD repeat-containing protein 97 isoform X2 [Amblyraja radiata]|uniref:WD repeat-containing protein 97 isoform X2 n=1 Tax=Amblyraja radiata TaxID=386614 RepID=UPI001401E4C4|nr:WD repeat-containing protein 97 isoform X2 [Amblyraja radiata]